MADDYRSRLEALDERIALLEFRAQNASERLREMREALDSAMAEYRFHVELLRKMPAPIPGLPIIRKREP